MPLDDGADDDRSGRDHEEGDGDGQPGAALPAPAAGRAGL